MRKMQIAKAPTMLYLLIVAAVAHLQTATATPLVDLAGPQLRGPALLCGNYSIDVGQTMYIKSKKFAKDYPKNQDCDYTFHCTDYAASLVLNCKSFSLHQSNGCSKDFMKVYDNNAVDSKFCGTDGPINVTTGENFLGVKFKTNNDGKTGSGFFCRVICGHVDDKTTTTTTSTPAPSTTSTTTQSTTSTTTIPISTPASYSGCRCGVPLITTRTIGGLETDVGKHPWQAGIAPDRLRTPYCGATLLNNKYIITAAHCVHNIPNVNILLGEHDWQKVSPIVVRKPKAGGVHIHPGFNPTTKANDLAIIELDVPINLNGKLSIKPICLPDPATEFTGKKGIATGWGVTSESGSQSSALQEVEVTIGECPSDDPNHICAGEPEGGKDACTGDDGGPLAVEVDGRYVLVGVTAKRSQCARPGNLGVYTKIQSNLAWIESMTSDGKICEADMPSTTTTTVPSTTPTTVSTTTTVTSSGTTDSATSASTTSATTTTMATTAAPTLNPGLKCQCGIPPNSVRASGPSKINKNPWTVALMSKNSGKQICSGAIVNTLFIVTARSCISNTADIQIRANSQDLTSLTASRYINRNVDSVSNNNDLALIKLDTPLSLTNWDGMRPACLPTPDKIFTNSPASHSGYGNRIPSTNPSSIIKKTDGHVIWCSGLGNNVACFEPAQTEGFCGADIGGPIVAIRGDGRAYFAGIATKDNGCSRNNMLFQEMAKVSEYYDWIWDGAQAGRFCAL